MALEGNPVEKLFYGRVQVVSAGSLFYFTRSSAIQRILFQLKYHNHPQTGLWLGRLLGQALLSSNRFTNITAVVPVPLHPRRQKQRGYNQSQLIAQGIAEVCGWPVLSQAIYRPVFTTTQTRHNRETRLLNLQQAFAAHIAAPGPTEHLLLVDDVITTGATLEACAQALKQAGYSHISIAAAAYTLAR